MKPEDAVLPVLSVRRDADGRASLTEDGRAEFQALRGEIIERLRAQQQATQFTMMLITALLAGTAALPGRVDAELLLSFGSSTALIPVTLLALLFASLASVYAEQEVGVAYAGMYIARSLGMPWEHARHAELTFGRRALARSQQWAMLGAKYMLAAVPALALWLIGGFGIADVPGLWRTTAAPAVVWLSAALWLVVTAVLVASATGVATALLTYRSVHRRVSAPSETHAPISARTRAHRWLWSAHRHRSSGRLPAGVAS